MAKCWYLVLVFALFCFKYGCCKDDQKVIDQSCCKPRWDGTAPFCKGGCNSGEVQVKVDVHGGGKKCWTGTKAECCPKTYKSPSSGHVYACKCSEKGNACYTGSDTVLSKGCCTHIWRGTSPFCSGECNKNEVFMKKDPEGDGKHCVTGDKDLCCPGYYQNMHNKWIPCKCNDRKSACYSHGTSIQALGCCQHVWDGTSPACNGACNNQQVFMKYDKSGDGKYCLTGMKALCCPAFFLDGPDSAQMKKSECYCRVKKSPCYSPKGSTTVQEGCCKGYWDGTAPSCEGSCDKNSKLPNQLFMKNDYSGDGAKCATGWKAYCCPAYYTHLNGTKAECKCNDKKSQCYTRPKETIQNKYCCTDRWRGTSPYCAGKCIKDERLIRKQAQGQIGTPSCLTGKKAQCCPLHYKDALGHIQNCTCNHKDSVCSQSQIETHCCGERWDGTAWFCKGQCHQDERTVRFDVAGDGYYCWTGMKALCCPMYFKDSNGTNHMCVCNDKRSPCYTAGKPVNVPVCNNIIWHGRSPICNGKCDRSRNEFEVLRDVAGDVSHSAACSWGHKEGCCPAFYKNEHGKMIKCVCDDKKSPCHMDMKKFHELWCCKGYIAGTAPLCRGRCGIDYAENLTTTKSKGLEPWNKCTFGVFESCCRRSYYDTEGKIHGCHCFDTKHKKDMCYGLHITKIPP